MPVVPLAQAAVEIGRRAAGRDEHHISPLVNGHRRPSIGGAGLPGWSRIPGPFQLARLHVEGRYRAALHLGPPVVADGRTHDHRRANYHRSRRHLIVAVIAFRSHSRLPKLPSAGRADRDQPRVQRAEEHPAAAHRHPASRRLGVAKIASHVRIEHPSFGPRPRIERDHLIERSDRVQEISREHRRRLKRRDPRRALIRRSCLGVVPPSPFQPRCGFRRDIG